MSSTVQPSKVPGARVLILSHRATVLYIGPVSGQEGDWAGIEYDDPTKGKHDGITGGVRYFSAASPTSGSFVRLEKVDFGCSVLFALSARYTNQRGEVEDVAEEEMYVHTATNRRVQIQVVGVEKIQHQQSKTNKLVSARLVGAGVSHVGEADKLSVAASSLLELDLTCNLISAWDSFVPGLCEALPGLQVLNLSDNAIIPPSPCCPLLPTLRALVLNDCQLTWPQVLSVQEHLPNLQELHVSGNKISSCETSTPGTLQALQVLSLDDNQLQDWPGLCQHLGSLPHLRILSLCNNPLSGLVLPSNTPTCCFNSLEALHIAGCQFGAWSDVDALNSLPALQDLRITSNPVLLLNKTGGRSEVIGRVARLHHLNGAAVSARERRDAELRYLQIISSSGQPEEALGAQHPRFAELKAAYGEVLATVSATKNLTLADMMINIKLTCVAAAMTAKMGSHDKKLPQTTQLSTIRLLCEKLFKVRVADQLLYIKAQGDPIPQPIEGDDTVTLGALGIQDAYEIVVDQRAA